MRCGLIKILSWLAPKQYEILDLLLALFLLYSGIAMTMYKFWPDYYVIKEKNRYYVGSI